MKSLAQWGGSILTVVVLASAVSAAEVASGRIKGVDADKKEFVLTDGAGKDFTFKLSDQTVMNRGGKESQSDLSAGESVYVYYDKGVLTWTAKYILIREGDSKTWELHNGKLKGYEGEKKYFTYTTPDGKDLTYPAADAKAWLNNKECKFDDLKIGEPVLLVLTRDGGQAKLKWVMCERK